MISDSMHDFHRRNKKTCRYTFKTYKVLEFLYTWLPPLKKKVMYGPEIVQLYSDSDCSYGDIERVLRHEAKIVPKKTIWAIIKKYKEHGTIGRLAGSGPEDSQSLLQKS